MSQEQGAFSPDYLPCSYGTSRLCFRGPKAELNGNYIACLGGVETFGRFMPSPYPSLIAEAIDVPCVNLGANHAGPEFYLEDQVVLEIARKASVVVMELPSCSMVSNPFYRVHPRRNDRIVEIMRSLRGLYPDVDFTEFHFINHMLETLLRRDAVRFIPVLHGLQTAWLEKVSRLIEHLDGHVILMWLSRVKPPQHRAMKLDHEPLFVSSEMIAQIVARTGVRFERVIPSKFALEHDGQGMVYDPLNIITVKTMLGSGAHLEVTEHLLPVISELYEMPVPRR